MFLSGPSMRADTIYLVVHRLYTCPAGLSSGPFVAMSTGIWTFLKVFQLKTIIVKFEAIEALLQVLIDSIPGKILPILMQVCC